MTEEINVIWVLATGLGFGRHTANSYWVIRKYKRGTGYSARDVEMFFSGYTRSGTTEKFKTFEELVKFLNNEHPTRKNYGFMITPYEILEVLENSPEEKREFWSEEIAYLKKIIGEEEHDKPQVNPLVQKTLLGGEE